MQKPCASAWTCSAKPLLAATKQRIINMAIVRERIEKEQADRAKAAADAKEKK